MPDHRTDPYSPTFCSSLGATLSHYSCRFHSLALPRPAILHQHPALHAHHIPNNFVKLAGCPGNSPNLPRHSQSHLFGECLHLGENIPVQKGSTNEEILSIELTNQVCGVIADVGGLC